MLYPDINKMKSPEMVAVAWATIFKETCLNSNTEELDEKPSGFFNTFLALTAQHASTSFYEQQMYLNETNPSTAILKKSLMSGLQNDEISNIYATPASARFAFCVDKQKVVDAIDKLSSSYSDTDRYLLLNKDTVFTIDSYPSFTLQRNVKIMYKDIKYVDENGDTRYRKNVYALYDDSDVIGSDVNPLSSYVVQTREIASDGKVYVLLYLDCKQETRTYIESIVINSNNADFKAQYTNNLVGFELYVEEGDNNLKKITALPEGSTISDNYQCFYSLSNAKGVKTINIVFDKNINTYKPQSSQKLHLIIWTSYGAGGNIDFPKMNQDSLESLSCNLRQDVTDKRQTPLNNIEILILTKDTKSSGGQNEMTFEQLKRYVISKKRSNDTITSDKQLQDICYQYGLDVKKIRHDTIMQNYRAYKTFYDRNNYIVASIMTPFRFIYKTDLVDYPFKDRSHTIISPKNYFIEQDGFYFYDHDSSVNTNTVQYIEDKETNVENFKHQTFFPFLIHVNATKYVNLYVIDPNVSNINTDVNCLMVNDNAQDSVDISNFTIYRNYCSEKDEFSSTTKTIDQLFTQSYKIYFVATFGNPQTSLDNIEFKMKISSESNYNYLVGGSTKKEFIEGSGNYKALISFDLFVDDSDIDYSRNMFGLRYERSVIDDGSTVTFTDTQVDKAWRPYPVSTNPIPNTRYCDFGLTFEVAAYFKCNALNNEYNELAVDDPNNVYRPVYDGSWLTQEEMGETGTDTRLYCVTAYKTGAVEIMKNLTDDMSMNVKIDTIVEYSSDEPTKVVGQSYICTIYDVLGVDRIYSTSSNYESLLESFYDYKQSLESVRQYLIEGFKLFCGVKKTEGKSDKFKIRRVSDGYEENLNSLSLDLEFDVQMTPNIEYDADYVRETIVSDLTSFINEFNDKYLSLDILYERMKAVVPNIAYITIKKLNGYDVGDYQSITNDTSNVEEALSVRMIPPGNISDDQIDTADFVPAITINFINQ